MAEHTASILVVDDDPDICQNLSDILEDLGYDVDTAGSGKQALERIGQHRYDLALIDLKMPGMDGLSLYREIKRLRSGTVAIVVTAYATAETTSEALEAGAWKVLPKPLDMASLLPLVDEAIRQPLVMVVDDDHDLCDNLWQILRERGFRICLAGDEQEAQARLADGGYRVILIDMKLPRGDGKRVFQLVRKTNPEARVVLVTGFRSELETLVEQVISEGADAVCYKPFDMPQLLKTVQELAQTQR